MMVLRTGFIASSSSTALCVEPSKATARIFRKSSPLSLNFFKEAHMAAYQSAGFCSDQPGRANSVMYSVLASP